MLTWRGLTTCQFPQSTPLRGMMLTIEGKQPRFAARGQPLKGGRPMFEVCCDTFGTLPETCTKATVNETPSPQNLAQVRAKVASSVCGRFSGPRTYSFLATKRKRRNIFISPPMGLCTVNHDVALGVSRPLVLPKFPCVPQERGRCRGGSRYVKG